MYRKKVKSQAPVASGVDLRLDRLEKAVRTLSQAGGSYVKQPSTQPSKGRLFIAAEDPRDLFRQGVAALTNR